MLLTGQCFPRICDENPSATQTSGTGLGRKYTIDVATQNVAFVCLLEESNLNIPGVTNFITSSQSDLFSQPDNARSNSIQRPYFTYRSGFNMRILTHSSTRPGTAKMAKECQVNDGHKHQMYRYKSPYAGETGLRLPKCQGCGVQNETNWYECVHCTKKRCLACRQRPKDPDMNEWFEAIPPAIIPAPVYPID